MANELVHYGVKGMKWGVRRKNRRSMRKELEKNDSSYPLASQVVKRAKKVVKTGAFALGTAAVGSAVTKHFADKGETAVAASVYKLSKTAFNAAIYSVKINAGMLAINAMMTNPIDAREYLYKERKIKEKYRKG